MHYPKRRRKALLLLPNLDLFHHNKRRGWMDMDMIRLPRKNTLIRDTLLQNSVSIMLLFISMGETAVG